MNIGDRVKVEFEMNINQMEQSLNGKEIITSGFVKLPDGTRTFCRVPMAACELISSGIVSVMKEVYAK